MKNPALFSSKNKRKKLKCRLLQFLFGALRAKTWNGNEYSSFDWLQFATRSWDGTLIGKNLLPQREQILSLRVPSQIHGKSVYSIPLYFPASLFHYRLDYR